MIIATQKHRDIFENLNSLIFLSVVLCLTLKKNAEPIQTVLERDTALKLCLWRLLVAFHSTDTLDSRDLILSTDVHSGRVDRSINTETNEHSNAQNVSL